MITDIALVYSAVILTTILYQVMMLRLENKEIARQYNANA